MMTGNQAAYVPAGRFDLRAHRDAVETMKNAVRQFNRGLYTIGECEYILNDIIVGATAGIADPDERFRVVRLLKRKGWRMMLIATERG